MADAHATRMRGVERTQLAQKMSALGVTFEHPNAFWLGTALVTLGTAIAGTGARPLPIPGSPPGLDMAPGLGIPKLGGFIA